jgi:hypothetical protein
MKRLLLVASIVLAPAVGHGHALLLNPPPRSPNDSLKTAPCGTPTLANSPVTTLVAGQQFEVEWMETIDHPGHYRLAFSLTPDAVNPGFDQNVLKDNIADVGAPATYKQMITVPSTPCENCAIQFIQCMTANSTTAACANNTYYYCANVRIVAADGDGGPLPTPDAGPDDPDAGPGDTPDAGDNAGAGDDPSAEPPGLGCDVSPGGPSGHGAAAAILLGAGLGLAVLARLRRRPATSPRRRG